MPYGHLQLANGYGSQLSPCAAEIGGATRYLKRQMTNSTPFPTTPADFIPINCETCVVMAPDVMQTFHATWSQKLTGQALDELHGDLELNRGEYATAVEHYRNCDQSKWRIRSKLGFSTNKVGDYQTAVDMLNSSEEYGTVFDRIQLVIALSEGKNWLPTSFGEEQEYFEEIPAHHQKIWRLIRSNIEESNCNGLGFLQAKLLPQDSESDKALILETLSRGVEKFPQFADLAVAYCTRARLNERTRAIARRHISSPYGGDCHSWLMNAEYHAGNLEIALALAQQGMQESENNDAWRSFALFSSQILLELNKFEEFSESLRLMDEADWHDSCEDSKLVFATLKIKNAITRGIPMEVESAIGTLCFDSWMPHLLSHHDLDEYRYTIADFNGGRVIFEHAGLTTDEMYQALGLVTSEKPRAAIIVSIANEHDNANIGESGPDARSPIIEALLLDTWCKTKELWLACRVAPLFAEKGKWNDAGEAWMWQVVYEKLFNEEDVPQLPGDPKTDTKWKAFLKGAATAAGSWVNEHETLACYQAWNQQLRDLVLEKKLYKEGLALLTQISRFGQNADLAFDYGLFHHLLCRKDDAIVAYRKCLSLKSSHASAMSNWAIIAQERMDFAEAKSILRMAETISSQNSNVAERLESILTKLRQWLREYDVTEPISNWIAKYSPTGNESYEIEHLSLWNAIVLLALYRACGEMTKDFTLDSVDTAGMRLMPTSRLNGHVLDLIRCGWIFPSATSPLKAFVTKNGEVVDINVTEMEWQMTPTLVEFIRKVENIALDHTLWPNKWKEQLEGVAKELAIDECKQYLDARMEQIDLTAPDGPKTNALLTAIVESYSIGQAFYFIWSATRSVGDGLARYDRNRRQAANSFVSRCQGTFDRARSEQWEIDCYNRSHSNPRSATSQVFQDLFLRLNDRVALTLTVDQMIDRCGGTA